MRPTLVSLLLGIVVGISLLLATGCGGDTSATSAAGIGIGTGAMTNATTTEIPIPFSAEDQGVTTPEEQPSPYGAGTTEKQSVGTMIDGLQLRDIRWSDHGSYFRIVFEMGTSDGKPVLQVPHADATMSVDQKLIRVVLGGIRSISSNANVAASSLNVSDTEVLTIKRLSESDDQALVYSIELAAPATYSLAGLGSPGRIVVDVTKS